MIWRFLGFELDDQQCELRCDGAVVELRRKVFDVLRYLVMHGERLVTKEELLEQVWPEETIHEAVVAQNIAILRKVLDDSREQKRAIQTVHGRGYRFVAQVEREQERSSPVQAPRAAVPDTPFVGREHTMRELSKLLESACAGRGQFAVITGEAGIGKTRASEELAAIAVARGAQVHEGRCYDGEGAPAYWPWIQILRSAAGDGDRALDLQRLGAAGSAVAHLVSENANALGVKAQAQVGQWPRPAPLDSAEARFRLFDGITAFLAQRSKERPLVLIFDDLHWADEATLHLLRFLAREVQALPLLVLATTREIDVRKQPTTGALLGLLVGAAHVHRLYLNGLPPAATAELAALSEHVLSDAALRELHALTEGNPFFVHQVLRLFADDAAHNGARARLELPNRVREIIALRLHGLDPRARRLLALASVVGQRFALAVIEQLAGGSRAELLEQLDAALALRIIREAGDDATVASVTSERPAQLGKYEFAHALIREHLYATLGESERILVHERVGLALENLYGIAPRHAGRSGQAAEHLSELAYHFCRAAPGGEIARAVDYCLRAAEHALHLLAFEQAVFQYQSALEALSCRLPIDEARRFELKLALGSAQFRASQDGNPALLGAAEIARRLERPELLVEVVFAMLGWPRVARHGRTHNSELAPLLEEALRVPIDDQAVRARLLSAHALNSPAESPLASKRGLSAQALLLARAAGDDGALYDALLSELRLNQDPARVRERLATADELLSVAQRSGQSERIFNAYELRVQPLLALFDLRAADAAIAACQELAHELRSPRCELQLLRFALERALGDGRFDDVAQLTRRAVHVRGDATVSPGYLVSMFVWLTFARAQRGDREWFERHIDGMAANADKSRLMRAHVAYLCASFGEHERARASYAPLLEEDVLAASDDDDWLLSLTLAADAIGAAGDRDAAARLYPRLLPHAQLNVAHFDWLIYFGSCAHWLGLLACLSGERKAASEHFELALSENKRLGAKPAIARTALAHARLLLSPDGARASAPSRAQIARGQKLLREASEIAQALGMRGVIDEAAQLG